MVAVPLPCLIDYKRVNRMDIRNMEYMGQTSPSGRDTENMYYVYVYIYIYFIDDDDDDDG